MPDLEIGPFLGYDSSFLKGGTGPTGGGGTIASYWVQEEDGTSKWINEEGTGFWLTEESS